jgi:DNA replication protein DnaC
MVANFRLGASIFLWGEPGTGKTMMGSLILKRALALKYDGYFTSFIDLMNGYSDGFDDRESRSRFNRTMMHADVLMIDDPGKEQHASAKQADYSSSVLDSVIRTRNGHSTPTIITSNDDPEAFKRRYGSYVSSLISERTLVQEVKGIDFREIQNKRLAIEIAENLSRPVVIG